MKLIADFFNNLTITRKIQVFTAIVIIALMVVLVFFAESVTYGLVVDKAITLTRTNIDEISSYFGKIDQNLTERSNYLATSLSIQQFLLDQRSMAFSGDLFDPYAVAEYHISTLVKEIAVDPNIYSLGLFNRDGEMLYLDQKGVRETNSGLPLSDRIKKQLAQSQRLLVWTSADELKPVLADSQSSEALNVIRLVYDLDDPRKIIGIMNMSIQSDQLTRIYNYIGFNRSAQIYITSSTGRVLVPSEKNEIGSYLKQASFSDYIENHFQGTRNYRYMGREYTVISQFLEPYSLFVTAIVPYDELIAEKTLLSMMFYGIAAIVIILELLFTLMLSRSVARPMRQLARMMTSIGDGNMTIRARYRRRDEIGILAGSMDTMLERIVSLMDELVMVQKTKRDMEFKALQAQINPHFLYNTLESVSALAQLDRSTDLFTISKALAMFYKGVLSDGRSVISLAEELRITENYLTIQSIRYEGKFTFRIRMPEEMQDLRIVKLSIQPLVENSIYHGLKNVRRSGHILIDCRCLNGQSVISVCDNGIGFVVGDRLLEEEPEPLSGLKRKGFGLASIDRRLKLYFGEAYGLRVASVPERWTRVDVLLPGSCADKKEGQS